MSDPLSLSHQSDSHEDGNSNANRDRIIPPHARRAPGRPQKRIRSEVQERFGVRDKRNAHAVVDWVML